MKATLHVLVVTSGKGGGEAMHKTVDLPFAPSVGMAFECSAWKEPRKVKAVMFGLDPDDTPYLSISMGCDRVDTDEQKEQWVAMYEGNGWRKPTMDD